MGAKLIAIEGSDGAGKDTQTNLLCNRLRSMGLKVGRISFPRYRETLGGRLLYEVLKSERAHQYAFAKADPYAASRLYAIDREESLPYLQGMIEQNDVFIFDRYVESNLLHQGGKFKTEVEQVDFAQWLFGLEYRDIGLPKPDETIYLSIPFWLSRKRAELRAQKNGGKLDAVESDIDYVKQGHEAGEFYAKHFGWKVVDGFIDGTELSEVDVHRQLFGNIDHLFLGL